MKRILTLILVLVLALGMFASCDKIGQFIPGLGGECEHNYADGKCTECGESDPNYVPPHTHNFVEGKCECGEEDPDYVPTPEVDEGLQGAYDYLHQMYKSMKNTAGSYDLVKNVNVGADIFTVTWSVNVDSITITEADDKFTVNIPELELGEPAINYELTFVVANAAGETLTRTYKLVVPEFKPLTFEDYFEAEKGDPVVVKGIVTGIYSKSNGDKENSVFLQDLENKGGYYIYALAEDPAGKYEIGMTLFAKGNKDIYNGTHEIKDTTLIIADSTLNPVEPVDITELYKNAANTTDASLTGMQGLLVTIKGVTVLEAGNNGYYNWTLDGKKSYVRISGSSNCTTKAQEDTIIANHKANFYNLADVTGLVTVYNNAMYLAPVTDGAFSNFVEQEKPDSVKVEVEKGSLTVTSPIVVAGDVTLPTAGSNFADVAISWALAETANASLAGNVLTPVLPLTGSVEITLTATLTKGDVTDTKNFTVVIKALEPITIPEANEIAEGQSHNTYTAEKYLIVGTIKEIQNDYYGNIVIEDANGNSILVYGSYSEDGVLKYGEMATKPVVGDTVKMYGVLGTYNGTNQMKNAWIISWTAGSGNQGGTTPETPDTPDTPETPNPEVPVTGSIELTVDSLGVASQSYAAGTPTINGVSFEFVQLGNYGDGIQMRDKADKGTSMLWNTSAITGGIKEIRLVYSSSKDTYNNPDAVIFTFGNEVKGATYSTKLSTVSGEKTYVITPDSATYTYFYLEHDYDYSMYWASITIVLADGSTVTPETPVDPNPETPVDPNPETPVKPTESEWKAVTELKTGDIVIIGNAANGKLLSTVKVATHYNKGVNYSETDFANVTDAEKWVVTVNEDGSYSFTALNGDKLALAESYSSLNATGVNDKWTLEAKDGAEGIFYLKNTVRGNYIEWYASKDNWSSYGTISGNLFEITFYVQNSSAN